STVAPMMHDGRAIGCIVLRKPEPGLLAPPQLALLETFAAQAVIAIENVRLFTELRESLDQQTATAEVLQVISRSPTNVEAVLEAVVAAARRFCGAADAVLTLREGDEAATIAHSGPVPHQHTRVPLAPTYVRGRAILESRTIHVPDLHATDEYPVGRQQAAQ